MPEKPERATLSDRCCKPACMHATCVCSIMQLVHIWWRPSCEAGPTCVHKRVDLGHQHHSSQEMDTYSRNESQRRFPKESAVMALFAEKPSRFSNSVLVMATGESVSRPSLRDSDWPPFVPTPPSPWILPSSELRIGRSSQIWPTVE